jgi:hypothetical protein
MPDHVISHALLVPLGHQVLVRLTACLALLMFSGLLSADPHIGLAIRETCVRWRRRMSLIRKPPGVTDRRDQRESGQPPRSEKTAVFGLSAIELAVLAELNLEIARSHDELFDDASLRVETRRAAHASATALRERAESFHLQARRLSTQPMLYAPSMQKPASSCTAPERRTHERRTASRRRDAASAPGRPGGPERRTLPDRRRNDRRGASQGVVAAPQQADGG